MGKELTKASQSSEVVKHKDELTKEALAQELAFNAQIVGAYRHGKGFRKKAMALPPVEQAHIIQTAMSGKAMDLTKDPLQLERKTVRVPEGITYEPDKITDANAPQGPIDIKATEVIEEQAAIEYAQSAPAEVAAPTRIYQPSDRGPTLWQWLKGLFGL